MDALRREQQLDSLKDVRLIVGNEDADLVLAYGMVCLHGACLCVFDRDAVLVKDCAGGAPHFDARFLVGGLRGDERRLGQCQIVLGLRESAGSIRLRVSVRSA